MAMRDGTPLPPKIVNAPELQMGLELYWTAFTDLNSTRSMGMAVGPIPWHVVQMYAETYDFDAEQAEELHYFVRELDSEYLKIESSKISKGSK